MSKAITNIPEHHYAVRCEFPRLFVMGGTSAQSRHEVWSLRPRSQRSMAIGQELAHKVQHH